MGQAKNRKNEINALKAKGSVVFTMIEEAAKMLKIAKTDKAPYATKMNGEDLKALPYGRTDAGFFIVYARKERGGIAATDALKANVLMNQLQIADTGEYARFSTYCTFDRVEQLLNDCHEVFDTALIGFSTPAHLHLLAEQPAIL